MGLVDVSNEFDKVNSLFLHSVKDIHIVKIKLLQCAHIYTKGNIDDNWLHQLSSVLTVP